MKKNLDSIINIIAILVGIISTVVTIVAIVIDNPTWEGMIIGIILGLTIGLAFFIFLRWLTKQSWFPWLSIIQPIIQSLGREKEIYQIADQIRKGESGALILVGNKFSENVAAVNE